MAFVGEARGEFLYQRKKFGVRLEYQQLKQNSNIVGGAVTGCKKADTFRRAMPVSVCKDQSLCRRGERLGMSNIGHWVTGIALIKARDTCGVVIGFRSRSVHRDLTLPPPCFSPVSIFKTLFHTERVSLTKTSQKQENPRRSCRIICHILMKKQRMDPFILFV